MRQVPEIGVDVNGSGPDRAVNALVTAPSQRIKNRDNSTILTQRLT